MREKPAVKRWLFVFLGVPPSCDEEIQVEVT